MVTRPISFSNHETDYFFSIDLATHQAETLPEPASVMQRPRLPDKADGHQK